MEDEYARTILVVASHESVSAKRLSDECDASLPTIYRRTASLRECDLLEESVSLDPDGNHRTLYETAIEHIGVTIKDGAIELRVAEREDAADQFSRIRDRMSVED